MTVWNDRTFIGWELKRLFDQVDKRNMMSGRAQICEMIWEKLKRIDRTIERKADAWDGGLMHSDGTLTGWFYSALDMVRVPFVEARYKQLVEEGYDIQAVWAILHLESDE